MPLVSIIILTYNSSRHIEKLFGCLLGKFEKEINTGKLEVVVIDNKSQDDTVSKFKKLGKGKFRLVENGTNAGFARGINLGAKNAKGQYFLFINPDAEFADGDLDLVVSMFEKDKKLGIMGGAIKTTSGGYEKSAGRFIKTFEVLLLLLGLDESLGGRVSPSKKTEVDFVSGGFMMVPKTIFIDELSGFDEDFFMYIEDMELCYRAKKKGYKVLFNPDIQIVHEGQGSSSRGFAVKNIFSGLLLFQRKHGSMISYFMVRFMLTVKARLLVIAGKMFNNKYLVETYSGVI